LKRREAICSWKWKFLWKQKLNEKVLEHFCLSFDCQKFSPEWLKKLLANIFWNTLGKLSSYMFKEIMISTKEKMENDFFLKSGNKRSLSEIFFGSFVMISFSDRLKSQNHFLWISFFSSNEFPTDRKKYNNKILWVNFLAKVSS
jgi:hypothetical protein